MSNTSYRLGESNYAGKRWPYTGVFHEVFFLIVVILVSWTSVLSEKPIPPAVVRVLFVIWGINLIVLFNHLVVAKLIVRRMVSCLYQLVHDGSFIMAKAALDDKETSDRESKLLHFFYLWTNVGAQVPGHLASWTMYYRNRTGKLQRAIALSAAMMGAIVLILQHQGLNVWLLVSFSLAYVWARTAFCVTAGAISDMATWNFHPMLEFWDECVNVIDPTKGGEA